MKIVINDANILIDLAKLDLLDVFSKLILNYILQILFMKN